MPSLVRLAQVPLPQPPLVLAPVGPTRQLPFAPVPAGDV